MERYESYYEEENLEEAFSVKKPEAEAGYVIKAAMGPHPDNPKRVIKGWTKKKKAGLTSKKAKTGMTKSALKKRAKKAAKTKKHDIKGQKLAKKRTAKTKKANRKAGY